MLKNTVEISVIVTIHNAEKYLAECLDSVCNQTFPNIEILCIDGGSTDMSPEILKKYHEKDARIYIINDSNTSYGHKINVGLDRARGEYIAVLESDDMYEPYMLEKLYEAAKVFSPDFVNAEYRQFFDLESQRFLIPHRLYQKQKYNCLLESSKNPEDMEIMDRFWTGIYRKGFLNENQIRLNESPGASFQDMSFRFLVSVLADTVFHLDIPVYLYRVDNPGSSMKDPSKTLVIADEYEYLEEELIKRHIKNLKIWELFYYWKYMDFYGTIQRLQKKGRDVLFGRYQQELKKDLEKIPNYTKEKYPYTDEAIIKNPESFLEQIEIDFQKFYETNQYFSEFYSRLMNEREVLIFGCGKRGQRVYHLLYSLKKRIQGFCDNSLELQGKFYNDLPIYSAKEAAFKFPQALYLIANKMSAEEIKAQLSELGIKEEKIHIFMEIKGY